jgi:hypothetical protein
MNFISQVYLEIIITAIYPAHKRQNRGGGHFDCRRQKLLKTEKLCSNLKKIWGRRNRKTAECFFSSLMNVELNLVYFRIRMQSNIWILNQRVLGIFKNKVAHCCCRYFYKSINNYNRLHMHLNDRYFVIYIPEPTTHAHHEREGRYPG